MESVDFLLGNVDKEGQLEDDEVVILLLRQLTRQDLREMLDEGDGSVLRDYFSGGFDIEDLTKGIKTNGDGPILPGDDARDFSDEDSLAEDEGEGENMEEDDIDVIIQEGQVKQDDDEDRMSVDLFGPDMSQTTGQHFGADTLIALLGRDTNDENGLPWSDEQHDGIFDNLSPTATRVQPDEDMGNTPEREIFQEPQEPKRSNAELIKEWFPQFSPHEVLRFTELFGSKPAELNRPLSKVPRGIISNVLI
jgi:hypothetical protein